MIDDNEIREAAHLSTLKDGEVALFVQNGFYKGAKWAEKKINRRRKSEIDWEQRRYEIAKDLFISSYRLADSRYQSALDINYAVELADELIERLKKN